MWMLEGLAEAKQNNKLSQFLKEYFKNNEQSICYDRCHCIIANETFDLTLNGNDKKEASFLIQDKNGEVIYWIEVTFDFSDIEECFNKTLKKYKDKIYPEEIII